jgi:hypothetical protein
MKYKHENLHQFLGGYFNQDWDLEQPDPEHVIKEFLKGSSPERVHHAARELKQLIARNLSEEDLGKFLLDDLHCFYNPGLGQRQNWLKWVLSLITENEIDGKG